MTTFILILAIAFVGLQLYVRFSPNAPEDWHLEPAEVDHPGRAGLRLIGRDAPRFGADPDTVLQTFSDIALEEPRTRLLDGSLDEGMMTFVSRSRFWGFPDMITAMAVDEGAETKLSLVARARFGKSDMGVNEERLNRWLQDLQHRLGS